MRQSWSAAARALGGLALVLALLVGTAAGAFHMGQALAGTYARRVDMLAAGVDMMPVGTAKQIERLKRMRLQKP